MRPAEAPEQTCASVSILSQIHASILAASRVQYPCADVGEACAIGFVVGGLEVKTGTSRSLRGGQPRGLPNEANAP